MDKFDIFLEKFIPTNEILLIFRCSTHLGVWSGSVRSVFARLSSEPGSVFSYFLARLAAWLVFLKFSWLGSVIFRFWLETKLYFDTKLKRLTQNLFYLKKKYFDTRKPLFCEFFKFLNILSYKFIWLNLFIYFSH